MKNTFFDDFFVIFSTYEILHGLLYRRFVTFGPLHNLAGGGVSSGGGGFAGPLAVQLHQLGQVEPGAPEHLHLVDVDIVQGVDALAGLLDIHGHGVRDQLVHDPKTPDPRDFNSRPNPTFFLPEIPEPEFSNFGNSRTRPISSCHRVLGFRMDCK